MSNSWMGKKIVVVDDNREFLDRVVNLYKEIGLEVVGAVLSGEEALKKIETDQPDFVSLDIIMPKMDGVECYRKIKEEWPQVKAFFVSALASESRVVEAYHDDIPNYCFVAKPGDSTSLKRVLDHLVAESDVGAEWNPLHAIEPMDVP